MRTKVLLCAAALAAGALTSMAQSNVYSLNVVGYINLPLVEGFNLVANQLDADGSGVSNTVQGVFGTILPPGSAVYTYSAAGGYSTVSYTKNKTGTATNWSGNLPLNPGQGAWVSIPANSLGGAGKTLNVTTVGQVLQGNLVNANIPAAGGFSLISSIVPLSGGLVSALGYNAGAGDQVYTWNGGYTAYSYSKNKTGTATNWSPSEPTIQVGQGFWLKSSAGAAWSNSFKVN